MSLAALALVSLAITIIASVLLPKINAGIIAISLSFIVGIFFAQMTEKTIASLFPSGLFITLTGVTLLFAIAETNGLLLLIAKKSIQKLKGNTQLLPLLFFLFALLLSAAGPGNIAAVAVLAPIGMSIAYQYGISGFLMAVMICTGANAGAFSPIAPTGIILAGLAERIHMTDSGVLFQVFIFAGVIQSLSALLAYVMFGLRKSHELKPVELHKQTDRHMRFTLKQGITIGGIILLILLVSLFKMPLGLTAFAIATLLLLFQVSDSEESVKKIPWDAILLVTGVSVLIGVLEKAGSIDLATTLIAKLSTLHTINAIMAFFTGLISAYSSSSGVVMPTFIPLIPGILAKLGGTDTVSLLIAIAVGSHMVDVSPLSTLGALCIANAKAEKQKLFKNLMIWGLSMGVVGALLSYVFLDLL